MSGLRAAHFSVLEAGCAAWQAGMQPALCH